MRTWSSPTLIVAEHISLDGVIQSPGAREEDASGDVRLGGWIVPYADEATGQDVQDLLSRQFALVLGRCTYDMFAAYWPRVPAESGSRAIADVFNSVPKHVVTHRSDGLDWQNSLRWRVTLPTRYGRSSNRMAPTC